MKINSANHGQSSVEFALVLPAACLMIFAVMEIALTGVRSVAAEYAATRAARVRTVYQDGLAGLEANASLPVPLFEGAEVGVDPDAGSAAEVSAAEVSAAGRSAAVVRAVARPIFKLGALGPAGTIWRSGPAADALPAGLSDPILRGGDSTAPYCEGEGRYNACGYPE